MHNLPMNESQRKDLIRTALGEIKPDLVFEGGRLVNVYSGEIMKDAWLGVKNDRVAYLGSPQQALIGESTEVHPVEGRFILPGFIDGHTHLDSIFQVRAYANHALLYGNTTAVSEVAMIANAMGMEGVNFFLEETEHLPLRVFFLAPPLVPPFPNLETSRPFPSESFRELLSHGRCLGVGETYWPAVTGLEDRALGQYQLADQLGKTKEGHAAGARNRKLMAYAAAGTSSCHEATSLEEALERLRMGVSVMIREGYIRRELEAISELSKKPIDLRHVMLVTDIADPHELLHEGGMNLLLKKAVALGFGPVAAIQMATLNAAQHFGLKDLGGLAPGKLADLVIVDDLEAFHCHQVWVGGRLVASRGKLVVPIEPYTYPLEASSSIAIHQMSAEQFGLPADKEKAQFRIVHIVNETITREIQLEMTPTKDVWTADPERDILKAAVLNKSLPAPQPPVCFVKGVGLKDGALATSLIWDTNNILVVGTNDADMAAAVNHLIEMGGGVVAIKGRDILAKFPLPLCGIISPEPLPEIVKQMRDVDAACRQLGTKLTNPLLTFQTLPFTGLPYLRPTDKGLADIRKGQLVPIMIR